MSITSEVPDLTVCLEGGPHKLRGQAEVEFFTTLIQCEGCGLLFDLGDVPVLTTKGLFSQTIDDFDTLTAEQIEVAIKDLSARLADDAAYMSDLRQKFKRYIKDLF